MASTDIKDYYRRAWGLKDRVPFKYGGTWADWKVNYEDQMSFEEYLQDDKITKKLHALDKRADGGRIGFADGPPGTKYDITKSKISTEMKSLTKKYNKILNKAIQKGNLSTAPDWATFLNNQKLKHAGFNTFKSLAGSNNAYGIDFGVVKIYDQKRILANKLIADASTKLKHVPWMDIQRKISSAKAIDTNSWRALIDKHNLVNSHQAKVSQAFDHLLNNDVQLKMPKNLSKTMSQEGSLLRKVISDLTEVDSTKAIRKGLNSNKNYIDRLGQIEFANKSNLWTTGQGTTLAEILDDAAYRMDGNISWSSEIKGPNYAGRPSKNAFEYALRHFNHHGKHRTGKSQIRFFRNDGSEIFWDDVPFDNKGGKKLKPSEVYFIDSTDPTRTKWNTAAMEADHKNWQFNKKNPSLPKKPTNGLFDELYKAKDVYDNLLTTKVIDPRNPKGPKVNFGTIMKEVYGTGFDYFGHTYSIDHRDGVAKKPWNNLRIGSHRINQALYHIQKKTGISEGIRKKITSQLNKQVFSPSTKDVIPKIIKGQTKLISDVLTKGTKFDKTVINQMLSELSVKDKTKLSSTIQSILNKKNSGLNVVDIARWGSAELSALDDIAGKLPSKALSAFGKILKAAGIAAIPVDAVEFTAAHSKGLTPDVGAMNLAEIYTNLPGTIWEAGEWVASKVQGKEHEWKPFYEATFGREYETKKLQETPLPVLEKRVDRFATDMVPQEDLDQVSSYLDRRGIPGITDENVQLQQYEEKLLKQMRKEKALADQKKKEERLTGVDKYILSNLDV